MGKNSNKTSVLSYVARVLHCKGVFGLGINTGKLVSVKDNGDPNNVKIKLKSPFPIKEAQVIFPGVTPDDRVVVNFKEKKGHWSAKIKYDRTGIFQFSLRAVILVDLPNGKEIERVLSLDPILIVDEHEGGGGGGKLCHRITI